VTTSACRMNHGYSIEEVARLVEESTLGTVGARQLRDRDPGAATVIRARAYFIGTPAGRSWWQANQHSPDALRAKAREFAAAGAAEISAVLARLADDRQAATHPGGLAADPPCRDPGAGTAACQQAQTRQDVAVDSTSFQDFHDRERFPLTVILCQQAGLPSPLGQKLIRRAMAEAFDDWEQLAATGDPGEWVLGRALQLYRAHRQLPALPETGDPEDTALPGGFQAEHLTGAAAQCADVRVTGALATAASQVDVPRTPRTSASRYPRRQAVLQAEGSAVALTIPVMDIHVDAADWDADRAVTALYGTHYRSLVRLAALLVRDVATAEEVVQDSFVAMHGGWRRLRDSDKALSYLRRSVVNRSRSVLRHQIVADRNAPKPLPDMPGAQPCAIVLLERSAVVAALRTLPPRQREALVLRYYGDMGEAQIASVMGISRGAVRSHTARAMSALRSVLERERPSP
jgi:RNA polymerase sigma-70 factor (sigma-E family)